MLFDSFHIWQLPDLNGRLMRALPDIHTPVRRVFVLLLPCLEAGVVSILRLCLILGIPLPHYEASLTMGNGVVVNLVIQSL